MENKEVQKLISNAFDFILSAADDLWDKKITSEQQIKYSTIELYEGIELLLKARLMKGHWSLIVRDIDKYKKGDLLKGDFVSAGFIEICRRLKSVCNFKLSQKTYKAFDDLREHRNLYVHFVCNERRESIMGVQVQAWHHILNLLENKFLGKLSSVQQKYLKDARQKMLRSEEFLNVRYKEVKPQIELAKSKGLYVVKCPRCARQSFIFGDGKTSVRGIKLFSCHVCLCDDYINAASMHVFQKPGEHVGLAWCMECLEQAVVPAGDDISTQVKKNLPGKNDDAYICFCCGVPFSEKHLRSCESCGETIFGSGDDWVSYCPDCDGSWDAGDEWMPDNPD